LMWAVGIGKYAERVVAIRVYLDILKGKVWFSDLFG